MTVASNHCGTYLDIAQSMSTIESDATLISAA